MRWQDKLINCKRVLKVMIMVLIIIKLSHSVVEVDHLYLDWMKYLLSLLSCLGLRMK